MEIGCGFGQFTNQLNQVAENVIGFDISTAVNQASMRYPHCRFEVSSFQTLSVCELLNQIVLLWLR